MSELIATRKVYAEANDSVADRTFFTSGESVLIIGIYLHTASADSVSVFNGAGTELLFRFLNLDGEASIENPFILDEGMLVGSTGGSSNTSFTVLYRPI